MRIALFGGSFNPVHYGHLTAAERVLEFTSCHKIWFLPTYHHPFKEKSSFASLEDRIKMLKLALGNKEKMKLSLFEVELGKKTQKKSRTYRTVKALKKKHPKKEFNWVIGSNLVKEVRDWYKFKELLKEIQFIVVPIKGKQNWRKENWLKKNKAIVLPQEKAVEDISSREIRKRFSEGKDLSELVPEKVKEYIWKKLLYLPASDFEKRVLYFTGLIPKGRISTYKEIALVIGKPKAYRAVGNALNKNPFPERIPCHRIVKSNGKLGGYSKGRKKKEKILKSEGINLKNNKIQGFNELVVKNRELKKLNLRV